MKSTVGSTVVSPPQSPLPGRCSMCLVPFRVVFLGRAVHVVGPSGLDRTPRGQWGVGTAVRTPRTWARGGGTTVGREAPGSCGCGPSSLRIRDVKGSPSDVCMRGPPLPRRRARARRGPLSSTPLPAPNQHTHKQTTAELDNFGTNAHFVLIRTTLAPLPTGTHTSPFLLRPFTVWPAPNRRGLL